MVFEEVLTNWNSGGSMNKSRMLIKDATLLKQVLRFYSEYISLFEKNIQKKDKSFPSVPVKVFAYRQLSMLNSNDKILEKKFKNVGPAEPDPPFADALPQGAHLQAAGFVHGDDRGQPRP